MENFLKQLDPPTFMICFFIGGKHFLKRTGEKGGDSVGHFLRERMRILLYAPCRNSKKSIKNLQVYFWL